MSRSYNEKLKEEDAQKNIATATPSDNNEKKLQNHLDLQEPKDYENLFLNCSCEEEYKSNKVSGDKTWDREEWSACDENSLSWFHVKPLEFQFQFFP